MTEERIKELAEKMKIIFKDGPYLNWNWVQQQLNPIIRTIAAEARREGIEEMLKVAIFYEERWRDDALRKQAERLKEQGNG